MNRSILVIMLVLMTAIFITLVILPANLSAGDTLSQGTTFYKGNIPGCDCTKGGSDCYCLTNNFEEN